MLTKYEVRVLDVLWKNGNAMKVRDICNAMNKRWKLDLDSTQIGVWLSRLVKKECVEIVPLDGQMYFLPRISRKEAYEAAEKEFRETWEF